MAIRSIEGTRAATIPTPYRQWAGVRSPRSQTAFRAALTIRSGSTRGSASTASSSRRHPRCGVRFTSAPPGGTPPRLAQRGERDFGLAHQAICCLTALLDELPSGVARVPRPPTHLLGQHRATVEVAAHALGQIRTTARAEVGAVTKEPGASFLVPVVLLAGGRLTGVVHP